MWGLGHKCIADHFNDRLIVVEAGIGYESTFAKFRVFESYSWMSYIYGKEGTGDGKWYDCVIPNFFDPSDFFSTRGLKSPEDFEKEATRIEGKNAVLSLKYGACMLQYRKYSGPSDLMLSFSKCWP